ncbi:DUF397 domain-containing protein [Streptomyces sp. NPDC003006]
MHRPGTPSLPSIAEATRRRPHTGPGSECVEVAHTATGGRAVRDSKDPGVGIQYYTPTGWSAFIAGVKAGDLRS